MSHADPSLHAAVDNLAEVVSDSELAQARQITEALIDEQRVTADEHCTWLIPVVEDLACQDRLVGPGGIDAVRKADGLVHGLIVALPGRTLIAVLDDDEVSTDEIPADEDIPAAEIWVEYQDRRRLGLELVLSSDDGPWRRLVFLDRDLHDSTTVGWHDQLVEWFVADPQDIAGNVVRRCPTCRSYIDGDSPCPNCATPATTTSAVNPVGWHTDPWGRHQLRYFDGDAWTAHVSDSGVASLDDGSETSASAVPVRAPEESHPDPHPTEASEPGRQVQQPSATRAPMLELAAQPPPSPAEILEQLERLNALRTSGALSEDEFGALKAVILGAPD